MDTPPETPAVGDVLSAATKVTLDNAGLFMGIWAVCHLPTQILGFLAGRSMGLGDRESIQRAIQAHDWGAFGGLAVVAVIGLILGVIGYAATLLLAARALRGRPVALGDVLLDGAARAIPLAIVSILAGLCIGLGTLALIIPGLYVMIRLALAVPASVLEGLGPIASLTRSWSLLRGRFWEVVVFLCALIAVAMGASIALILAGLVLRLVGSAAGAAGTALAGLAVNAAQFMVSSWGAACIAKFYAELAERTPAGA